MDEVAKKDLTKCLNLLKPTVKKAVEDWISKNILESPCVARLCFAGSELNIVPDAFCFDVFITFTIEWYSALGHSTQVTLKLTFDKDDKICFYDISLDEDYHQSQVRRLNSYIDELIENKSTEE